MSKQSTRSPSGGHDEHVIALAREEVDVSKREVESARVRVSTRVSEREAIIEEPLLHEDAAVERTPVNRPLEGPVEPRYEGDVLVIPVVEEVLVVSKQLMLKEEIRIRRRSAERLHRERVTLRSEKAVVERVDGKSSFDTDGKKDAGR